MTRHASRSRSTKTQREAPRESASRPIAPEPAKRSSTRAPSIGPTIANADSRTRSPVGRVTTPFGAAIPWPFREPATIRTARRYPYRGGFTTRRGARRRRAGGRPRRRGGPRPRRSAGARAPARGARGPGGGGRSGGRTGPTAARRGAGPRRGSRGRARRARSRPSSRRARRDARPRPRSSSSRGRETSRQYDCSAPRPTRPRSWCSCASPNRSASWTIMIVAFGTSTPTSITVVATRTSSSPALNLAIRSRRSAVFSRPWTQPTR